MALGMEMMLKNMLGVDPEELKAQAMQAVAFAQEQAAILAARAERAEQQLAFIMRQNAQILALLENDAKQPPLALESTGSEDE